MSNANRAISYEEAVNQATVLTKQRVPFSKIAEHLNKLGYVSPKTKSPLKEQAVRNMVNKKIRDVPEAAAVAAKEPAPLTVRTPDMQVIEALRKIPSLGLSPQMTLKLVNTLLEGL